MKHFAAAGIATLACIISASAADLPTKAPISQTAAAFSWTGCYLGAHVGIGRASDRIIDETPLDNGSPRARGLNAGGQIGCDYQTGRWVLGAQGRHSWADMKDTVAYPPNPNVRMRSEVERISLATARIGYAFDRMLIYAQGGGAWARTDYFLNQPPSAANASASASRSGWAIGGGVEFHFTNSWSFRLDYNHMDFGTERVTFVCSPPSFCGVPSYLTNITQRIDTFTMGINYRFGLGRT